MTDRENLHVRETKITAREAVLVRVVLREIRIIVRAVSRETERTVRTVPLMEEEQKAVMAVREARAVKEDSVRAPEKMTIWYLLLS